MKVPVVPVSRRRREAFMFRQMCQGLKKKHVATWFFLIYLHTQDKNRGCSSDSLGSEATKPSLYQTCELTREYKRNTMQCTANHNILISLMANTKTWSWIVEQLYTGILLCVRFFVSVQTGVCSCVFVSIRWDLKKRISQSHKVKHNPDFQSEEDLNSRYMSQLELSQFLLLSVHIFSYYNVTFFE